MAFAEPVALTSDWDLRLGAPLISPHHAYQGYLSTIFTGDLKNTLPWAGSWLSQIFSAGAWLQVALASGFRRAEAMRAMHRAVARAHAGCPHALQATTKFLRDLSHRMPLKRCQVAGIVGKWLKQHAYQSDGLYSSWILPPKLAVGGVCGSWNTDFHAVGALVQHCTSQGCPASPPDCAMCVCVCVWCTNDGVLCYHSLLSESMLN